MQKKFSQSILLISFLLSACADTVDNVKKGLGGGKRNTTDEFLVKKKDPLAMPPKWSDLPEPGSSESIIDEESFEEVTDIEQLFKSEKGTENISRIEKSITLEESFLKKIKDK